MTKFDTDLYFNDKLNEYFNTETKEIISRLESSRDKAFSLDKIRDELKKKEIELCKFNYQGVLLHDSFRYHIVNKFEEVYKEFINKPVDIFLTKELPEIKNEDKKDFLRYENIKSEPRYDISFLNTAKTNEVIEFIAKSFVLNQL